MNKMTFSMSPITYLQMSPARITTTSVGKTVTKTPQWGAVTWSSLTDLSQRTKWQTSNSTIAASTCCKQSIRSRQSDWTRERLELHFATRISRRTSTFSHRYYNVSRAAQLQATLHHFL